MTNTRLDRDIKQFLELYPNFTYDIRHEKQCSVIKGDIDVCGLDNDYWESYSTEIFIDKGKYPYTIPFVKENSKRIKRIPDNHISEDGFCCLDIDHELEFLSKRGINIKSFYQEKIYPYFVNTQFKKESGNYSNGEYKHQFKGVVQFYNERLNLTSKHLILRILRAIEKNNLPGRNEKPCICGKERKVKNCHLPQIEFLKTLSKKRILNDIDGFERALQLPVTS
jgi:hypothetical protein